MIRLSKSSIADDEIRAVTAVLQKEFLGMGAYVATLENKLNSILKRPVVAVSSGTAALQLALQAIGVGPGDEVIVQSLTYVAAFQAISATGARPVSCEVDKRTMTLDVEKVERAITPATRAIMIMHYGGFVSDTRKIYDLAKSYNLRIVEDAAHAFGSLNGNELCGAVGDIVCFSFDGIKNITCGEGGALVTDDAAVVAYVKDARLLGVEKDTDARIENRRSEKYDVKIQGWRYHMSNINAAIGVAQLNRAHKMFAKRQELSSFYHKQLDEVSEIRTLLPPSKAIVPHIYPLMFKNSNVRDLVRGALSEKQIQTSIHYFPNHLLSKYKDSAKSFPVTEDLYGKLLTVPLHVDLTQHDIEIICDIIIKNCK